MGLFNVAVYQNFFSKKKDLQNMKELKTGDKAPDFSAQNEDGETVSLKDFKGKKLALFFYPASGTPGCTAEACSLRDHYKELQLKGINVLGVSPDSSKKQSNFIKKYKTFTLILSSKSFQYTPEGIINGFERFCKEKGIYYEIISNLEEEEHLQKDHAYFLFRENDLVRAINWSNKKGFKLGEDIGLISYDDTPIKEILSEGISVISNDFALMGKRAAEMILSKEKGRFINESRFIERKSL